MNHVAHSRWTIRLAVFAVSAAPLSQAAGQSVLLKPRFEPGRTVYVESHMRAVQTLTGDMLGEEGMLITIEQTLGVFQKVESVSGAGVKLGMIFDRMRIDFAAPMMEGAFDSDARSDLELLELAEIFEPMIGAAYTAELDRDFNVTRITGIDELVKKMNEAGGGQLASQFVRGMSNEQNKAALAESIFMLYPNKKVKQGDTWSKSIRRKGGQLGEFGVKYDYRVESVNDKRVVIAYTASLTRPPGAKVDSVNPMIKAVSLKSGSITGKAEFDAKTGQLVSDARKSITKMAIEMDMPVADGDAAPSMTIVAESTQTLKFLTTEQRVAQRSENQKKTAKPETDG